MIPKVFIIQISGNEISQHYLKQMLPSWQIYDPVLFEAIVPDNLRHRCLLQFGKKRDKIEFTETEKAVWYSHYECWDLCWKIKEPIIVVEHDVHRIKSIDPTIFNEKMACIAHTMNGKKPAKLGGGAYYITPSAARRLLTARHAKNINYNSDVWIHRLCDKIGRWDMMTCKQINDDNVGRTVEHLYK